VRLLDLERLDLASGAVFGLATAAISHFQHFPFGFPAALFDQNRISCFAI
jgi:hypothetical protein